MTRLNDDEKTICDWTVEHELGRVEEILEKDPDSVSFRYNECR